MPRTGNWCLLRCPPASEAAGQKFGFAQHFSPGITLVTPLSIRFQDPGGDDQALNLAGALVDFGDAGVAIIAFDGIFAAVTVAAVNLNRLVCDARGHFARK